MASKEERNKVEYIFVKPEIMSRLKMKSGHPFPPEWVEHEETDETISRRQKGVKSWLKEIVTETRVKKLRDDSVYFVIDFKIEVTHPQIANVFKKLKANVLSILDEKRTKVLVCAKIDELDNIADSIALTNSDKNIIFDIRSMKENEQIDKKILSDEVWLRKPKNIDIFVMPNLSEEKIEAYVGQAKSFLLENRATVLDSFIDKSSKLGMISVKIDLPKTRELLKEASFIYKVYETPSVSLSNGAAQFGNRKNTLNSPRQSTRSIWLSNLPTACVIDTGVSPVPHLSGLIDNRSAEPHFGNNLGDQDDHGTPVAFLLAYGENNLPRSRIISHKIKQGAINSNLVGSLGRAIRLYLHKTRVFSCSIRYDYNDEAAIFATGRIDRLIQASNSCVLFSAGNIEKDDLESSISEGEKFPTWLETRHVALPSDCVSAIAVGAYSKTAKVTSIAPKDSPAPFTRSKTNNKAMYNCLKPEIVENGGNLNSDFKCNGVGVQTVSSDGTQIEKMGTSFSTPIVAGHLAQIIQKYGQFTKNAETIKAILYSCCEPCQNNPQYAGFGKPNCNELLYSPKNVAKIVFEGNIKLSNIYLKRTDPANEISVYVPAGVDTIELTIVHSDDYDSSPVPGLHTYIEVVPDKPARESPPPPDTGDLLGKQHVKKLVWNRTKGVKGIWKFILIPRPVGIPYPLKENVTVRYGGVIKLSTERKRVTPLANEVRRNLKNGLVN